MSQLIYCNASQYYNWIAIRNQNCARCMQIFVFQHVPMLYNVMLSIQIQKDFTD